MALIYKPRYKYYNITFFALRFSSCWYKRWNHFWVYFQSCCRTKKSFDSPQQRTMCCDCPQRNRREEGNRETAFLLRCLVQPAAAAWYCFCFWGKLKKYLCHRCASLNTDSPGGGSEREREKEVMIRLVIIYVVVWRLWWGQDYTHPKESFSSVSSAAAVPNIPTSLHAWRSWISLLCCSASYYSWLFYGKSKIFFCFFIIFVVVF